MPWPPSDHGRACRGKQLKSMRCGENESVLARRWHRLFLLCIPLALVIVANGTAQDKSVSKRGSNQEISFEERLEAEQRLADLGYWTGPVDGNLDPGSRHALIAFQKFEGRNRTGLLTSGELDALRSAGRPRPRFTGYYHVEVDLRRQVLFIVDSDDRVSRILPVCTGSGKLYSDGGQTGRAHTPRGKFKVLRKINGWRRSPLGLLYYPSYIFKGVAIHGSPAVLTYPASHGCIRIPLFAAKGFSELTPNGTDVVVYDI
jgi:N-acetylmuramoyl-L-alanine amidase